MFLVKDHICQAGQTICEDAVGWGDHFLFALDGASGLTGARLMDDGSDAAWFAQGIRDGLCRSLSTGDERPTAEILSEILTQLRRDYEERAAALGIPVPPDAPSAGIALFREWKDGSVEFFGLGDCVGAAQKADGTCVSSCDEALPVLDGRVLTQMEALHRETGIPVLEARQHCNELLLHNRTLRNVPGGYWILDLSGVGLSHARVIRWQRGDLESISAFSDGFDQLVLPFREYPSREALHQALPQSSLETLLERLYTAQEADPQANRFPRLKFRDDACALWAQVML